MTFLGGLGLFLYGVYTTSSGLQKFAASRLKTILQSLTKKTLIAVLFGIVMTVAFQSSAATTVLVVEFVNSGLMSLGQALGIVLGSAVGTSITVQLLAFRILPLALGLIFVGLLLLLGVKAQQWKHLGQALIGFGIIFVGMANMSSASAPLRDVPEVYIFLSHLGTRPVLGILVGLGLTVIIQSSTAVFGIMMSLASQHLLGIQAIVPLVLGVHIGGTSMALLSSLTASKMDAKRTAVANTAYKVVGTLLVLPFLPEYARLVAWTTQDLQRQVANAHLVFALFMLIVFMPFNSWIARFLVRILPQRMATDDRLKFKYLDESSLEVPAIALRHAREEICSLGEHIAVKMLKPMPEALVAASGEQAALVAAAENEVDWYYRHISRYLVDLSKRGLTEEQLEECINVQFILKEMEYIGDLAAGCTQVTLKLHKDGLRLGPQQWENVREIFEEISGNFALMLKALAKWDVGEAGQVIREHPEITRLKHALQFNALAEAPDLETPRTDDRAAEKIRYAVVDLINLFYGIDEHTVNIAQVVAGIV